MNAIKDDVLRISNASFYVGKGEYELFVVNGDQLIKRKVQLGDSNFEYVEVVGGLEPGDEVVVSDMTSFKEKNKLKLRFELCISSTSNKRFKCCVKIRS